MLAGKTGYFVLLIFKGQGTALQYTGTNSKAI